MQGVSVSGLPPLDGAGPERAAEAGGGGAGYAAFLFCAENPGVLLPTVRSRCVELAVRPTGEENIQLLPQARTLLEAMAGGERQDMIRALVGLETGKITREALQQVLLQARTGAQQALRLRYGVPAEGLCRGGRTPEPPIERKAAHGAVRNAGQICPRM